MPNYDIDRIKSLNYVHSNKQIGEDVKIETKIKDSMFPDTWKWEKVSQEPCLCILPLSQILFSIS